MTYKINDEATSSPTTLPSMSTYVAVQLKLNDSTNPDIPSLLLPSSLVGTLRSLRFEISTRQATVGLPRMTVNAYLNGSPVPESTITFLISPTVNLTAVLSLLPPTSSSSVDTITLPNFQVARWNQLAFSVEGRTVDVYLNGALANSTLLENVPYASPTQITLNPQPGYDGQVGYVQAWPHRLTMSEIVANYKQTSDRKGKPAIPDSPFNWSDLLKGLENGFCSLGVCPTPAAKDALRFIQYEF
jgi:hypothetical protein